MAVSARDRRRRGAAEALRLEAERKRKRRLAVVAGCVVVALALLAVPVYSALSEDSAGGDLSSLGVPASEAGCSPVAKKPATGNQQHVPAGAPVTYDQAPPAYGPHYPSSAHFGRTFYTAGDRPMLGDLVHNLEHGYTILWYDESVASDGADVGVLQAIAEKFSAQRFDPTKKFIVAPYTSSDPGSFPAGKRLALTHWFATFEQHGGPPVNQQGITQYCERVSGEVVADFVEEFPYSDSPEPNAA